MKQLLPQIEGEEVRPQARIANIVISELPDEELVYDLKTHQAYCLNKTAAAVWKQCDGQQTIEQIAERLQQNVNTLVNESMVKVALHQLGKANLLEQRAAFLAEKPNQLRREVVRQIGLGAVAVLPLVTSIIAPPSAQAMSCGNPNNNANQNPVGCPCSGADDCASNCCGELAGPGNICVTPGSVSSGSPCRANCECASGSCPSATDTCV